MSEQRDDQNGMADRIRAELAAMSRLPFREELAALLAHPTDPEAMQAFANRFPDRRAQAIAIFGRLAGFTEKLEVTGSLALEVQRLSDVELMALYAETQRKLRALEERSGVQGERKALEAGTERDGHSEG